MSRHWVKLYNDINCDPRLDAVTLAAQAVYLRLLPSLDDEACFRAVPGEALVASAGRLVRRTSDEVKPLLDDLARVRLIILREDHLEIPAFLHRNPKLSRAGQSLGEGSRGGKSPAERSREYRERRRQEQEQRHGDRHVTESVTIRDAARDVTGDRHGDRHGLNRDANGSIRDGVTGYMATEVKQSPQVEQSVTERTGVDRSDREERNSSAAAASPLPPKPLAQRLPEPAPPPRSQNPESAQRGSAAISSIPQVQSPALENGYELALRLQASAGPRMACAVSPAEAELLERVVRGLIAQGQGTDLFDVLGAYIKAGALRWMQQREPSLGYLLERDGAVFVQYLNSARGWDAVGRPALDSKGNRVVRTANNPNGGRKEEPKPQHPPPATEAELAEARARWAEMKRLKREANNAS